MYYEKQKLHIFLRIFVLIWPANFFVDHIPLTAAGHTDKTIHTLPKKRECVLAKSNAYTRTMSTVSVTDH